MFDGVMRILKLWDKAPRRNFISVKLGIQIPFDNNEISAKAMYNARPDQDRTLIPKKRSRSSTQQSV